MRRAAFQFAAGFGYSPSNALRWKSSPMTAGCPLLLFRNIQVIILCTPFAPWEGNFDNKSGRFT